jgi:hypothetical protein
LAGFAHFFSVYVSWIAIPCLAISGYSVRITNSLIQIFFPFGKITMDEAGKILSSSGAPLGWYIGSIITSIGLIITVLGFALITWKIRKYGHITSWFTGWQNAATGDRHRYPVFQLQINYLFGH